MRSWKNKQYPEYRDRNARWVICKLIVGIASIVIILYALKGYLNV